MPRDLVRIMHSLFLPVAQAFHATAWRPPADVYRTRKGWLVKFDLAGVRAEDITLTADGSRVTVRGTRRDCAVEEGCSYYRMEIAYSHFERSVELPVLVDPTNVSTEYDNGMLSVYLQTEADQ
jgi:HSP20 family protein